MKKLVPIMCLSLAACSVSPEEFDKAVMTRASYDLGCEVDKIAVTTLQTDKDPIAGIITRGTFGASGCGKKMTYIAVNNNGKARVFLEGSAPYSAPQK